MVMLRWWGLRSKLTTPFEVVMFVAVAAILFVVLGAFVYLAASLPIWAALLSDSANIDRGLVPTTFGPTSRFSGNERLLGLTSFVLVLLHMAWLANARYRLLKMPPEERGQFDPTKTVERVFVLTACLTLPLAASCARIEGNESQFGDIRTWISSVLDSIQSHRAEPTRLGEAPNSFPRGVQEAVDPLTQRVAAFEERVRAMQVGSLQEGRAGGDQVGPDRRKSRDGLTISL